MCDSQRRKRTRSASGTPRFDKPALALPASSHAARRSWSTNCPDGENCKRRVPRAVNCRILPADCRDAAAGCPHSTRGFSRGKDPLGYPSRLGSPPPGSFHPVSHRCNLKWLPAPRGTRDAGGGQKRPAGPRPKNKDARFAKQVCSRLISACVNRVEVTEEKDTGAEDVCG